MPESSRPIAANLATYIRSEQVSLFGAVLATFAVALPTFVIILLIMAVFKALLQSRWLWRP